MLVVPDSCIGSPAATTTVSPSLTCPASLANATDFSIISSVELKDVAVNAYTPHDIANLLVILSSGVTAIIGHSGLYLAIILAVLPVLVGTIIAAAFNSIAVVQALKLIASAILSTFSAFLFSKAALRSEEHTSELQSRQYLVCRLLLEKKDYSYFNIPLHHE